VALLRQLWLGLSAYRLFPGSLDRPGFVAAVERIQPAAARALALGPVDVEIRGDGFVLEGEALPPDESVERLGLACFERRVEELVVRSVPDAGDLDVLYATLSRSPDELAAAGGAQELLETAGVTAVALAAIGPAAVEGADHVPADLAAAPAARRSLDPGSLTAELMLEDLHGTPGNQAETLLGRLRAFVGEMPTGVVNGIDIHSALHDVVTGLAPDLRRALVEMLIERVRDDPVAERLIGTMSNAELTRTLVDLGSDGRRDPVELARQLAAAGVRHLDIIDLTAALEAGQEEAGTIVAGLEQLGIDLAAQPDRLRTGSVSDVLSEYLAATEADDVRSMQAVLPGDPVQSRASALLAFQDYFSLESDLERVGEVLDVWADEVRGSLRELDADRVQALVHAIAAAPAEDSGGERHALFEATLRNVLDLDMVRRLTVAESTGRGPAVSELLAPFGDPGVELLLDLLAEEEDASRRALLLGILRRTARGHLEPVAARLDDPRWYVVRNAVNLLGSAGGTEFLARISAAVEHSSPVVRREAVSALVATGGAAAVPFLAQLVSTGDAEVRRLAVGALAGLVTPEAAGILATVARTAADRSLQRSALEELARRPGAVDLLRDLASGHTPPRLPWRMRRRAGRLLRDVEGGKR